VRADGSKIDLNRAKSFRLQSDSGARHQARLAHLARSEHVTELSPPTQFQQFPVSETLNVERAGRIEGSACYES
jgi:hypothetical protein